MSVGKKISSFIDFSKFTLAEKIMGRKIQEKVRYIKNYYKISWRERKLIQNNKIKEFVKYSFKYIPYYNKVFSENLVNKIEKDIKFFNDLPTINKKIIKENHNRLINPKIVSNKIYKCDTGGSTGEKISILYDDYAADMSSSIIRFCRNNLRTPGKDLHFASDLDIRINLRDKYKEIFKSFVLGRDNIFFSSLTDVDIDLIIKKIRSYKPILIHCHPSTMLMILDFCKKNENNLNFSFFESSGELLTENDKIKIENFFNCKVVQRYGQAEVGIIAYQFFSDENIYVLDNSIYCENLNEDIFVTNLDNRYMPLIRYQTGDIGKLRENNKGNYFKKIVGRKHECLHINNKIYLTHHIQDILDHKVRNINLFQIKINNGKKHTIFLNIENKIYEEEIKNKIDEYFQYSFEIKFVDKSEFVYKGSRSKFSYILN